MSMYKNIDKTKRRIKENCIANALRDTEYARRFTQGSWSFLGPGSEKKWYGTHVSKPDGEWDKTAEGMMLNSAESGHLERGEKIRGKRGKTIHLNGCNETIEMILRTILLSVNQLSVHGAVSDLCGEKARDSRCTGKPAANENLKTMVIPTELPTAHPISQTDADVQGNLLREDEQKFAELLEQQKLIKPCSNGGFLKNIDKGQSFITFDVMHLTI